MRQFHLMRQTTSVEICWQQGREEGSKDVEWLWLFGGCVVPPIQEMRLAVTWVGSTLALFNVCAVWPCGL